MTLLAWPALLLLLAAGVLIALATLGSGPRQRDVGTLMIWKRVAAKRDSTRQRRRKYDLLLWLCLSAVLLGSLAAARPGLARTETEASIAVFVEPTGPSGRQHDFADVKSRAEAQAAGRFVYFMAGGADVDGDVRALPGGPICIDRSPRVFDSTGPASVARCSSPRTAPPAYWKSCSRTSLMRG